MAHGGAARSLIKRAGLELYVQTHGQVLKLITGEECTEMQRKWWTWLGISSSTCGVAPVATLPRHSLIIVLAYIENVGLRSHAHPSSSHLSKAYDVSIGGRIQVSCSIYIFND